MPATIYRLYDLETLETVYIGQTKKEPPIARWERTLTPDFGLGFEELLTVSTDRRFLYERNAILTAKEDGIHLCKLGNVVKWDSNYKTACTECRGW